MTCHEHDELSKVNEDEYEEYDEETMMPEHLTDDLRNLADNKNPNLDETEIVNLGDDESVRETRVSIHLTAIQKEKLVELLKQYVDVFSWSYDDIPGLSTDIVSHRLPINSEYCPVKRKTRKFKPDLSLRIKEEAVKQIESKVVEVTKYPTWLSNIVPVAKKDGNIRICVDYREEASLELSKYPNQW